MLRLNALLIESGNVGEALNQALRMIMESLGYDMACRWHADYDSLSMHCVHIEAVDGLNSVEFANVSRRRKFAPGEGGPGRVWLSRRLVVIPESSKDTNFPRLLVAARCDFHGYVAFPILFERHIFGVFEFLTKGELLLTEEDLRVLEDAGRLIGQFLYKQGLEGVLAGSPSEERLSSDLSTEAIVTINTESKIVLINEPACQLFGYSKRELIGDSLTTLMPHELRQKHLDGFARYLSSGRPNLTWNGIRLPALHKSGTVVEVEISFGEIVIGDRRLFSGYVRSLAETKTSARTGQA